MIEEVIQNIFNSDDIKQVIDTMDKQTKGETLTRLVNYCTIMGSNEEMESFIHLSVEGQVEFVKEKIAEQLNIENKKEKEQEIFKYACEKLLTNGYVYHITNSVVADKIMEEGLTTNKALDNSELYRIIQIYKEHGEEHAFGWSVFDADKGWFYDGTLLNIEHYSNSPEWFSQFCGESRRYSYGVVPEQNRHAFRERDYSKAINNVQTLIKQMNISEDEEKEILEFFNKNWKMYEKATPKLLLIPRKDINEDHNAEDLAKFFNISYLKDLLNGNLMFLNDEHSELKILPEHIKTIDISKMFGSEINIEMETINKQKESELCTQNNNIKINQKDTSEEQQAETKSIAEYIEDSLKMKNIKIRCYRSSNNNLEECNTAAKCLGQVINYCILFRSNEGIDEYMSLRNDEARKEYIINKTAKILSISSSEIESHQEDIANYFFENFKKGGFAFHTTNSLCANDIMKNGISKNNRLWTKDEIIEMNELFGKYTNLNILGWLPADMRNSDSWFYDLTPKNIEDYAGAPEWFAQFCGESIYGYKLIKEENRSAFRHRNYEIALDNINKLIKSQKMEQNDANKVLNFFHKFWKMFEDSKSCTIMIPKTKLYPKLKNRQLNEYTTDKISFFSTDKQANDYSYFINRQLKEIVEVDGDINLNYHENIDSEDLQCVDISQVIERSDSRIDGKKEKEIITMEKCIDLIKGLDPSKIESAYSLLKTLQQEKDLEVRRDESK